MPGNCSYCRLSGHNITQCDHPSIESHHNRLKMLYLNKTRTYGVGSIYASDRFVDDVCRQFFARELKAITAKYKNRYVSTFVDIGGFSFNYHKHIHTGEGGMLVTNDSSLADRMQLLRNHGEVVISRRSKEEHQFGILGMNMRLGEIEGAIGKNQLLKLDGAVASRQRAAKRFEIGLKDLIGLKTPFIETENTHVFYVFGMELNLEEIGISRAQIISALKAEGVPGLMVGYQNLHKLPLFAEQLTYRNNPLPFSLLTPKRALELRHQILPIAETLHTETFFGINWCAFTLTDLEVDLLIGAFHKVWTNLNSLRDA